MTIRVLLADDEELVRTGLRMVLGAEPGIEVVAEARDGLEAVEAAALRTIDVVLMDIRMPNLDGVRATGRLLAMARTPTPRVVILTTYDLDENVLGALREGASGFLLKDTPADQLVHAVRVVAAGDALLAPSVTRRLVERFARSGPDPARREALAALTARELEVLELLARGLSNAQIADALVVGEATVKTHVSAVLSKLGLRDRAQAVVFAYESGLVEPGAV